VSRFLICAQPLAGHVNPASSIARALVARGHDVRFYTGRQYKARVEATGARHVAPNRGPDFDGEDIDRAFPDRAELRGLARLKWDIRAFLQAMPAQVADLEELLAESSADAVLTDSSMACGYVLNRKHGLPWATLGLGPLPLADPLVPPFGLGLRASTSRLAALRNRVLNATGRHALFRSLQSASGAALLAAGAEPDGRFLFDLPVSPYLLLQPGVASMEYPRRSWPTQLHFVGALLPPPSPDLPSWWADRPAAERVVLVTQGTVATGTGQLLVSALRAFAHDPSTLIVADTRGRSPEVLSLGPLPHNARIAPFIPHGTLMPHVDVLVTNGGYHGHLTALQAGVPLVVAPGSEDKPEVARRVAYTGTGIDLKTATPSPRQVHAAVCQVLSDSRYRTAAAAISAELRANDGPALAAELLERLVSTGDAVRRDTTAQH
jgi:UDP:flavonoid glycosyltransferase YjiC (YdhE family)